MRPVDVAVAYVEAFGKGDMATAARYVAEGIEFESPMTRISGAEPYLAAVGEFAKVVLGVDIVVAVGDGERAMVMYEMRTRPFGIEGVVMPRYVALTYTADVDWSRPEYTDEIKEYDEFDAAYEAIICGGAALYPTATATIVRRPDGKGGNVSTSDGPYAETKEALTGFYILECADLDEAIAAAAQIPSARHGVVEVRPVIDFG